MKALIAFASKFGVKISLNPEMIVEKTNHYYLLNAALRRIINPRFHSAGLYLGKTEGGVFFPSFSLLNMLEPVAANKVILEPKAAWLFICGRDIFTRGIVKSVGSCREGDYVLVLNKYGECLGFGVLTVTLAESPGKIAVKNLLDLGNFLHRES